MKNSTYSNQKKQLLPKKELLKRLEELSIKREKIKKDQKLSTIMISDKEAKGRKAKAIE